MRKKIAATIVVLAALVGVSVVATLAVFSDQEVVTANLFQAGTVDLTLSETSALVSFEDMLPGDVTTNDIVVTNATGSADLRYAISASATNLDTKALKDQLVLTVKTVDVTTPLSPCDQFDGTELYTGDLDPSDGKLVGDPAQGAQSGDRALAADGSETLCFRVSLPTGTGNDYKSAETTATFAFAAEQTANN